MDNAEKPDEAKQETKAPDTGVAQPSTAPQKEPPAGSDTGGAGGDPQPRQPILVRVVGGDDLKPFEKQTLEIARDTLAISRRTYWIAILGFGAALAAACFVGVQVAEMTDQTQILASQSEGANAGALIDEMNTRKQLGIAQQQAKAAQDSVAAIQRQTIQQERPWIGIADEVGAIQTGPITFNSQGNGASVPYQVLLKNFGTQAAQDVIPTAELFITEDIRAVFDSQRQVCSKAIPRGMGFLVFPGKNRITSQTIAAGSIAETDSKTPDGQVQAWLTVCIFYTDQFGCQYRTPLTYNFRDPGTDMGVRFDARPNIVIQGVFREYYSAIAPYKNQLRNEKDYVDYLFKKPQPSLGEPCPK